MTLAQPPGQAAAEADLLGFGKHCSAPDCGQLDFLPFRCSGCQQTFCLDHRTPGQHQCPNPPSERGAEALVCPVCARAVLLIDGEDANVTFERHSRTGCDASNYAKVHKKPKCPVPQCRERLTTLNEFVCAECGTRVCLKHRLASDHACQGRATAAAAAASRFSNPFAALFGAAAGRPSSGGGGAGKAAPPPRPPGNLAAANPAAKPAARQSSAKAKLAAAARQVSGSMQTQLQDYRDRHSGRGGGGGGGGGGSAAAAAAGAGAGSGAAEVIDLTRSPSPSQEPCPQCGATFSSVQQLIDHAAAAHAGGWASGGGLPMRPGGGGGGGGGGDRCPHCGLNFLDPVALVAHVERVHAGAGAAPFSPSCALC